MNCKLETDIVQSKQGYPQQRKAGDSSKKRGGIAMEPVYSTVDAINGDYARMTSDSGVENQVAVFLLPEGTNAGSRLVGENFEWRLL